MKSLGVRGFIHFLFMGKLDILISQELGSVLPSSFKVLGNDIPFIPILVLELQQLSVLLGSPLMFV